ADPAERVGVAALAGAGGQAARGPAGGHQPADVPGAAAVAPALGPAGLRRARPGPYELLNVLMIHVRNDVSPNPKQPRLPRAPTRNVLRLVRAQASQPPCPSCSVDAARVFIHDDAADNRSGCPCTACAGRLRFSPCSALIVAG